jgi:hypothetical protein
MSKNKQFNPLEAGGRHNAENAKNPKESSDWGGLAQGSRIAVGPAAQNEAAPSSSYGDSGRSGGSYWLGGPQNGNETPGNDGNGGNG